MTLKVRDAGGWNVVNALRVFTNDTWNYARVIRIYTDTFGWIVSYPDKPVVTGTVFVEGSPFVGNTLSISVAYPLIFDGSRNVLPSSFSVVWQRSLNGTGPWEDTAVTTTSYSLTSLDTNYSFRVKITGTNAKGSTNYFTNAVGPVSDPTHTFLFGDEFKIDTNAFIMINNDNIPLPNSALVSGKVLRYFTGDYKQYDLWYKSDLSQIRFIHRLYRADQSRQIAIEFEIRFFQNSQNVWVFVRDAVDTQYIFGFDSGAAWGYQFNITRVNSNSYPSHIVGWRYSVPMNSGAITAIQSASTETPSAANGWIQLPNQDDQDDRRTTLLTRSNMFYPTTPTVANATYSTTTSANVSWSGSNANSYRVVLTDNALNTISSFNTTSTSATITGLTIGTSYFVLVYPNSRSDFTGQEGFFGAVGYTHSSPPSAPNNLSATVVSDVQVNLSWTAPSSTGGSAITGYTIDYKRNVDSTWINVGSTLSLSTPVSGLTASTLYNFRVAATNSSGTGPYAQVNATTLAAITTPGAPNSLTASAVSSSRVDLSWTAPGSNGGSAITGYTIDYKRNVDSLWTNAGSVNESTFFSPVLGLSASTLYNFRVAAINVKGTGSYAFANATTLAAATVPGAPTNFSGTSAADGTFITLSWTAPSDGGSPITSYEFQRNQSVVAGPTWLNIGNTTSWVSSGTSPGTLYYFRIRAINAVGTGSFVTTTVTATTPPPTTAPPTTAPPTTAPPTTAPPTTKPPTASIGSETKVLTFNYGYIEAKYLSVGDELVSLDVSEIPTAGETFNVDEWRSNTFTNNGITTTIINNIYAKEIIGNMIKVNGEWFTDNHNILSEKDGVYAFTPAAYLDNSYKIFDYDIMDWVSIYEIEVQQDVQEIVYVLDCEPYDVFFTQNALVYNNREYI